MVQLVLMTYSLLIGEINSHSIQISFLNNSSSPIYQNISAFLNVFVTLPHILNLYFVFFYDISSVFLPLFSPFDISARKPTYSWYSFSLFIIIFALFFFLQILTRCHFSAIIFCHSPFSVFARFLWSRHPFKHTNSFPLPTTELHPSIFFFSLIKNCVHRI